MAGKRPRQIQRTTSMSQLGTALRFSHGRNGGFPSRGQSYPPEQELGHISMQPCPELGELTVPPLAMEECNSMVIDSSAEESLCTSRTPWPAADMLPSSNRVPVIDGDAFFCFRAHQWNFSAPLYGKEREATHLRHGVFDMGGSVHPAYFLDICYLCSKSLGHGRDVFIYRGDRAFCSVECRHLQIMADERREKGTITGPAEGSVAIMQVGDAASANLVETVAAA